MTNYTEETTDSVAATGTAVELLAINGESDDSLSASESLVAALGFLFSDQVSVTDIAFRVYGFAVLEELSASAAVTYDWVVEMQEALNVGETVAGKLQATMEIDDRITVEDVAGIARLMGVDESLEIGSAAESTASKLMGFIDGMILSGVADSKMVAIQAAAEYLVTAGQHEYRWALAALESLEVAGDEVAQVKGVMAAVDTLEVSAIPELTFAVTLLVGETIELQDTSSATAALLLAIEESLNIGGVVRFPGGEDYQCWVTNAESFSVWQYENYPFNSFAYYGGRFWGRTDDGLYELEVGDDDDGDDIQACVTTGLSNMGTSFYKSVPAAYIAMKGDGELFMYTNTTDKKGMKRREWYRVKAAGGNAISQKKVPLKRGVISVHWQFELENVDGGDFNVNMMQLTPMVLKRR
jgi:hypothetical protein